MSVLNNVFKTLPTWTQSWKLTRFFCFCFCFCFFFNFSLFWVKISYGKLIRFLYFVLSSNHFRKWFSINAGVWLRMENKFSRNYFQLTGCFEGFNPEMVWSENFHFKPFPNSHAKTEEREPSTSTSLIYEPTDLRTDHAFNFADHAFDFADFVDHTFNFADLRTHEPIFNPEPSTHKPSTSLTTKSLRATNRSSTLHLRPKATNPRTDLSLSLWFLFFVWFWSTHEPLISDFLLLLWWCGWWCFGGFPVV